MGTIVALGILALGVLGSVRPAEAFELFSWWRRELLEVRLEPGDWARFRATEITEEGAVVDTFTVTVLAADDPALRWIRVDGDEDEPSDFLLIDPALLDAQTEPLDAVRRLLRREADGRWSEEDLDAQRESRLVRRHLEDPFEHPEILREALPDTTVDGRVLSREAVTLMEVRREERRVGNSVLVLETDLRARAQMSPSVPLLGLLESRTVSAVTTRTESADGSRGERGRRSAPPLFTETSLRCLDFGRLDPPPAADVPR